MHYRTLKEYSNRFTEGQKKHLTSNSLGLSKSENNKQNTKFYIKNYFQKKYFPTKVFIS